jgi:nucleotide-binding universal stress UspA family protein
MEAKMKVLVGYDGSKVAKAAMEIAKKHAIVFGGNIIVVNCMNQNRNLEYKDIRKVEKSLKEEVQSIIDSEEIPCETHLVVSGQSAGEDLVQFVKQNKVDEIIVGIRNKSKAGKLIFGSTAQYVVLTAPCPVVCVK